MPRAPRVVESVPEPKWTLAELLKVKHLGPSIIGQEMHDAAQAVMAATSGGTLGPAITLHDDPAYFQGGPIRVEDGRPIYADPRVQAYRDALREAAS